MHQNDIDAIERPQKQLNKPTDPVDLSRGDWFQFQEFTRVDRTITHWALLAQDIEASETAIILSREEMQDMRDRINTLLGD